MVFQQLAESARTGITKLHRETSPVCRGMSIAELQDRLDYDPVTGVMTWKISAGKARAGSRAGCFSKTTSKHSYIQLGVKGRNYYAQVLAWAFVYGKWPSGPVTFRDGNSFNCAIDNLQVADASTRGNESHLAAAHTEPHEPPRTPPALPPALQEVALIDAKVAAAVGGMSVSWWYIEVAAGRAPQPVVRQTRCTRWTVTSVREFWQRFADQGALAGDAAGTAARAKHASLQAKAKREERTDRKAANPP